MHQNHSAGLYWDLPRILPRRRHSVDPFRIALSIRRSFVGIYRNATDCRMFCLCLSITESSLLILQNIIIIISCSALWIVKISLRLFGYADWRDFFVNGFNNAWMYTFFSAAQMRIVDVRKKINEELSRSMLKFKTYF